MSSRAFSVKSRQATQDLQIIIAVGFLALTCFGAAIDRRGSILDRSSTAPRLADRVSAPLGNAELVREMLTHD